jgi:hypothetical protein
VALLVLVVVMFLTGVALIVWWLADRCAQRVTAPAASYDGSFASAEQLVPGLSPETVAYPARHRWPTRGAQPGRSHRRG